MSRRKLRDHNIRKLGKAGTKSFSIVLPIELIKSLSWRLKQKVIAIKWGKGILIKDWKKK